MSMDLVLMSDTHKLDREIEVPAGDILRSALIADIVPLTWEDP